MGDSNKVPDPKMLELGEWMQNIQLADDHGCILMGVGYVESLLGDLLSARMIAESKVPDVLLRDRGALGSLSARIDATVAFGVISPELGAELHRLRKIRNRAAHEYKPMSLEKPPVSDMCNALRLVKSYPTNLPITQSVRMRFVMAVSSICMTLQTRIPEIQRCKRPKLDSLWLALIDDVKRAEVAEQVKHNEGRIPLDSRLYES